MDWWDELLLFLLFLLVDQTRKKGMSFCMGNQYGNEISLFSLQCSILFLVFQIFQTDQHNTYFVPSSNGWDRRDAEVACRMAGFDPQNSVAIQRSTFSRVFPNIAMSNVQCKGSESKLSDCPHSKGTCSIHHLAGVKCEYDTNVNKVTLVGGNNTNLGNVMLNGKPIWYVFLAILALTGNTNVYLSVQV